MPDWHHIFGEQAAEYDRVVACEDYQNNIPRALNQIHAFAGADVVELGAGTGRLTGLCAPLARTILAFDISAPMLEVASAKLARLGRRNWLVGVADHRHLPVGDGVADISLAGWTLCLLAIWEHATWQQQVGQALAEMRRVLRPGGTAIILETLGTGCTTPQPPREELALYYAWLTEHGFASTWIRTDYRFESQAEGRELIRLLFGEAGAEQVVGDRPAMLPECTGIWWRRWGVKSKCHPSIDRENSGHINNRRNIRTS